MLHGQVGLLGCPVLELIPACMQGTKSGGSARSTRSFERGDIVANQDITMLVQRAAGKFRLRLGW